MEGAVFWVGGWKKKYNKNLLFWLQFSHNKTPKREKKMQWNCFYLLEQENMSGRVEVRIRCWLVGWCCVQVVYHGCALTVPCALLTF